MYLTKLNVSRILLLLLFFTDRNYCPEPVHFAKLAIVLSNAAYSTECVVASWDGSSEIGSPENPSLQFDFDEVKMYKCQFQPNQQGIGKELQVSKALLFCFS